MTRPATSATRSSRASPCAGTTDDTDIDLFPETTGTNIRWAGAFEPKVPGTGTALEALLERIVLGYARGAAQEAERRSR